MPVILVGFAGLAFGAFSEKKALPVPNISTARRLLTVKDFAMEKRALSNAKSYLKKEEGYKLEVYKDTRNFLTVGIGHKVVAEDNLKLGDKISDDRVNKFFEKDVKKAFEASIAQSVEINAYNEDMISRLTSVNFQLGTGWRTKFSNTWALLKTGKTENIKKAIKNIENSAWAEQTPSRALAFAEELDSHFIRG